MNPLNSPWNKPKPIYINDQTLYFRWKAIEKHLTIQPFIDYKIHEGAGFLTIIANNQTIYLAKKSSKFRLESQLDWAYYTPKTIANAINSNSIEQYYEIMLKDINSDPNIWKDKDFEMELKAYYAAKIGRASLINTQ
jgi:hypothetical protein